MPHFDEIHDLVTRRAVQARRAGRSSVSHRTARVRSRWFFLFQCAVSAAIAWFIAKEVFGHAEPFFAPVAAIVALGVSFGQRLERTAQIVLGVAVGVAIGDLVVAVLGSGYWQLAIIVFTAMVVTTFLDGGVLTTTQAGVQSAIITIFVAAPDQAFSRWVDAAIGGTVALLAATITPAAPLRKPQQHTASVVADMSSLLWDTAAALTSGNLDRCEAVLRRARNTESSLDTLESLADDGLAVIRSSPFRRRHLPAVQAIADLLEPLDRAIRNLRVLVRRGTIALRQGESVPTHYLRMVRELAEISEHLAADLEDSRPLDDRRIELYELAEMTAYVTPRPTLSSEVIRAQVRSIVLDLLMVTGLSFEDALTGIPSSYSLHGEADEVLGEEIYEDEDEDQDGDQHEDEREDRNDDPHEDVGGDGPARPNPNARSEG